MKGLEIKVLRLTKGIKQSELSEKLGINNTYLSLLEGDKLEEKGYSPDFIEGLKSLAVSYLNKVK